MKDLRTKTVKAAGWVLGSQFVTQAASLGFGIALARLLVPDDFGLIAMVVVFTGLAGLMSNIGMGSALVQKKDAQEEHYSSVFWLNMLLGSAMGLTLYFTAPWLSAFYQRPEVEDICKVLSINSFVSALALVPRIRFLKKLLFKYLSLSDLAAMIGSGAIGVTLAAMGYGYWSLVVQQLGQTIISTVLIWGISGWRPRCGMSGGAIRELFGFSSSVFATKILHYVTSNLDKLILGKILGGQALGFYDKAYSMMLFPLQNVSHIIGSVMFPALSLIQSDTARVREIYLRSTRAIALLTFPMMAGMFVVAEAFVLEVLGPQWAKLIPVLQIFCIAGVAKSIVTVTGSLYLSQGAAALQLRVNLYLKPIAIAGICLGLPWGLVGVATGVAVTAWINGLITLTVAGRLVDLGLLTLLRSLAPTLLATLLMALLIWPIRQISGLNNELLLFLLQVAAGCIIYWGCVAMMQLRAYVDIMTVIHEEFASWRAG